MILFIFPINIYIARKQHGIQKYILKMKGKRVRLINEVLSGIKVSFITYVFQVLLLFYLF